jgi:8-oxo-dGTP pyrophosphatase MutT (NUDIX family)
MNALASINDSPGLLSQLAANPTVIEGRKFRSQIAALCWRAGRDGSVEVLLITSRDTGRWVIPKGWPMKGKDPHQAAATEAKQEAGVLGRAARSAIGHYTYVKRQESGSPVPCTVSVYPLEVTDMAAKFREKGQRSLQWFSCAEASRRVAEPELRSLLARFESLISVDTQAALVQTSGQ